MEISDLRKKIDDLNGELTRNFLDRMECTERIAALKKDTGSQVINSAREDEILARVTDASGELALYTAELFRTILELSRARQNEIIDGDFRNSEIWKKVVRDRLESTNIVLVGMPGSGKSTIGAALAKLTGRQLIETDEMVEKLDGRTIPEIFTSDGERYFRRIESSAVAQAAAERGVIIATGGGCVTMAENYIPLHESGIIYHLERDLDKLAVEGRPLSQIRPLSEIYVERRPMYLTFRDRTADNNGSVEDTARRIWRDFVETAEKRHV